MANKKFKLATSIKEDFFAAYQEGLSQDRTQHRFWFEIGKNFLCAARLQRDPELFDRSIYFLNRATTLYPCSEYYFVFAKAMSESAEFEQSDTMYEYACTLFEKTIEMQN